MKRGTNIALGAIVGATVGVLAGVLTAPKSGKETRGDIKKKAEDVKSRVTKTRDGLFFKAEEVADDLRTKAEGVIGSTKRNDDKK